MLLWRLVFSLRLTFISVTQITLHIVGGPHLISERPSRKRLIFHRRGNSVRSQSLDHKIYSLPDLQPVAYPADFRLAIFHSHMSQFSKINSYLYIYLCIHICTYSVASVSPKKTDSHFSFLGLFFPCSDSISFCFLENTELLKMFEMKESYDKRGASVS